jgi:integrase/recombinase XerD
MCNAEAIHHPIRAGKYARQNCVFCQIVRITAPYGCDPARRMLGNCLFIRLESPAIRAFPGDRTEYAIVSCHSRNRPDATTMQRSSSTQPSLYGADGRRKYLTPTERDAFIRAALACSRPEVGALGLILAYSGCRISEALSLRVSAIDAAGSFVAIRSLKKRDRFVVREVPLPEWLGTQVIEACKAGALASDHHLWSWSRGHAWLLIHDLLRSAGIASGPHATAKGLRHGFAIHALHSGVPINMVKRWLGHASLATTEIYLEAIGSEERALAARMWQADPRSTGPVVSSSITPCKCKSGPRSVLPVTVSSADRFEAAMRPGIKDHGVYLSLSEGQRAALPHCVCAACPLRALRGV